MILWFWGLVLIFQFRVRWWILKRLRSWKTWWTLLHPLRILGIIDFLEGECKGLALLALGRPGMVRLFRIKRSPLIANWLTKKIIVGHFEFLKKIFRIILSEWFNLHLEFLFKIQKRISKCQNIVKNLKSISKKIRYINKKN